MSVSKCSIKNYGSTVEQVIASENKYQPAFYVLDARNVEEYNSILDDMHRVKYDEHPDIKRSEDSSISKGGVGSAIKANYLALGNNAAKIFKFFDYKNYDYQLPSELRDYKRIKTSDSNLILKELRTFSGSYGDVKNQDSKNTDAPKLKTSKKLVMAYDPYLAMAEPDQAVRTGFKYEKDSEGNETEKVKSACGLYTMDFIPGDNYSSLIKNNKLEPYKIFSNMRDVLEGVETIHGLKSMHLDVKPSNIQVAKDGKAILLDPGLVTNISNDHNDTSTSLPTSYIGNDDSCFGSLPYMDYYAQVSKEVFSQSSDLVSWMLMFLDSFGLGRGHVTNFYLEEMAKNLSYSYKTEKVKEMLGNSKNAIQTYMIQYADKADLKIVEQFDRLLSKPDKKLTDKERICFSDAIDKISKLSIEEKAFLRKLIPLFKEIVNPDIEKRPDAFTLRLKLERLMKKSHYAVPARKKINITKKQITNIEEAINSRAREVQPKNPNLIKFKKEWRACKDILWRGIDFPMQKLFHNLDMNFCRPERAQAMYDLQQYYKLELLPELYESNYETVKKWLGDSTQETKAKALKQAIMRANHNAKLRSEKIARTIDKLCDSNSTATNYIESVNLLKDFTKMQKLSVELNKSEKLESLAKIFPGIIYRESSQPDRLKLENYGWNENIVNKLINRNVEDLNLDEVKAAIQKNIKLLELMNTLVEFQTNYSSSSEAMKELAKLLQEHGVRGSDDFSGIFDGLKHLADKYGYAFIHKYMQTYYKLLKEAGNKVSPGAELKDIYEKIYSKPFEDSGFEFGNHKIVKEKYYSKLSKMNSKNIKPHNIVNAARDTYEMIQQRLKVEKQVSSHKSSTEIMMDSLSQNMNLMREMTKKLAEN